MWFLAFEGLDGSGKTSLAQSLALELGRREQNYLITREPGGTSLGEALREILLKNTAEPPTPKAEVLLYMAGRAQHVERVIRPALARRQWVLCDRFGASSIAFQAGARGLSLAEVSELNDFATGSFYPNLVVLLDLAAERALARRQKRMHQTGIAADRFEQEELGFHQRVRASYLEQAERAREQGHPWLVLDAERPVTELTGLLVDDLRRRQWLDS